MGKVVAFASATIRDGVPYFLTDRETRRHGVDVGRAMQSGILTADDFRALLAHCRACPDRQGERTAESGALPDCTPPKWCANIAVIEGLRGIV
ncbi:hypothetical protein DEA8626_03693 [Defluviimonas aquaemixtae]|uniref:DUF6455 domain-containing protein n=1 Tax=Albidovulum aquaemixtae TaxID=1542388 RepID=A0A2R8BMR9_9RHOB|nr:DUF6455 family protein [Defluviimonas aquaemixtae]SPH24642.1 hypothetical protein DEA8626_03693 [Defluviimonas aquaemixtae]